MANWVLTNPRIGVPGISVISDSSAPAVSPGTIERFTDTTGGAGSPANGDQGEFIYLAGVGSTAVGSVVTYDPVANTTTLAPTSVKNGAPVAIAMQANTSASKYAWYQISGVAAVAKTATKVNPGVPLYMSGTAGQLYATLASGKGVLGLRTVNSATVASATGTVNCIINRPHFQLYP